MCQSESEPCDVIRVDINHVKLLSATHDYGMFNSRVKP